MEPIAIVGLSCLFPGSNNPEAFWELIRNGVDAITEVPSSRWRVDSFYDPDIGKPGKMNTRWGGFLNEIDRFDASFFQISPREAEQIDPQQRLLLEVAWESLENAGIAPKSLAGSKTGVFIGICNSDYSKLSEQDFSSLNAYNGTGRAFSIAANRLSYFLNLKGPSMAIDTACSSSLVAAHLACQSLQLGESDLCLVGGVNLILSPEMTIIFSQARMMAADGRCKTFDASADGYVRGEGCGIVVLKRLDDALRDGDNIQAIIRGSAVNQDGLTNGLMAPNGPSQQAVIRQALANANVKPTQISYVEVQGSGTSLGDAIEVNALKTVLTEEQSSQKTCWISTVKTNIGHLEAASGIASLIKVVLCLQHQLIPPHLHFKQLNPYISLEGTPLKIPNQSQFWETQTETRFAGVSAFGFGGTNCHLILEESPLWTKGQPDKESINPPLNLLTLSAKTDQALIELAQRYVSYLPSQTNVSLGDICFTANTGRTSFEHRLAVIAESIPQLSKQLESFIKGQKTKGLISGQLSSNKSPKIAFLFNGEDSQYRGIGRELYETQPVFRKTLDQCAEILAVYWDKPLLDILYPSEVEPSPIDERVYTPAALFALEYAQAQLWISWGIEPGIVMGHNVGEYVAACVAGIFSLEDGLKLIAHQCKFLSSYPSDDDREEFRQIAQQLTYQLPQISLFSTMTNTIASQEIATPEYWVRHLDQLNPLADRITNLLEQNIEIVIEIGIQSIPLDSRQKTEENPSEPILWLAGLQTKQSEWELILSNLSKLYVRGVKIDWQGFAGNYVHRKLQLPTYPFQRQRYWVMVSNNFSENNKRNLEEEKVAQTQEIANGLDVKKLLREVSSTERIKIITYYLKGIIAHTLGLTPNQVIESKSLNQLGLDSLMAMELKKIITTDLGLEIAFSKFIEGISLDEIINYIAEQYNSSELELRDKRETSIQSVPRKDFYCLSFSQRQLWLLSQLEGIRNTYVIPIILNWRGNLKIEILHKSLAELIKRHEILRTTFAIVENNTVQVIHSNLTIEIDVVNLESLTETEQKSQVQQLAYQQAQRFFNLSQLPLFHVTVIQTSSDNYDLVLTIHHLIADGWSIGIIFKELSTLYRTYCQEKISPLSDLPIQYVDFAVWQNEHFKQDILDNHLNFWQQHLAQAPKLINLPTDFPRPQQLSFQGERYQKTASISLTQSLKTFAKSEGVTLFTVLLATLRVLLYQWTQQSDSVLGTVVSGRNQEDTNGLIGCFINFIALRTKISEQQSFREFLNAEKTTILEVYQHQNCPFDKVVEAINPERNSSYNPIYNVALLLQNFPLSFHYDFGENIQTEITEINPKNALLDLRFLVSEKAQELEIVCEYSTDLFNNQSIEELVKNYLLLLEKITENPEIRITELPINQQLQQQAKKARARDKKQNLVIAATFTADPIEASLNYWMDKLNLPTLVEFAPYNQVFQELLNPNSLMNKNQEGVNIILVRSEDWVRFEPNIDNIDEFGDKIRQTSHELLVALQQASQTSQGTLIVVICPATPNLEPKKALLLNRAEAIIVSQVKPLKGVNLITAKEIEDTYPVSNYYDGNRDELGHIPYTETYYGVLGTAIARKIYALKNPPYKVIALDCDNTLWQGICGEDGARGVKIDQARQALQSFLVEQQKGGKLLCLCSKNQEEDVWAVFEAQGEMPLKKEHLVAWKINWQAKSQNLKALAQELNVGLDSFIFIDDNPVECAEVEANCPEVLSLQLPENLEEIGQWLQHIWAFDQNQTTAEDQKRTQLYQDNRAREELRKGTESFAEFLGGLNLEIEINEINEENIGRVSQLTQRTNQFNLTTIRRREDEIQKLLATGELEGRVVSVKDRFGEYGLVGVLLFRTDISSLTVDTFLLSCRVLGRGVELEMLKYLSKLAQQKKLKQVNLSYNPTAKNQPALEFLEKVGKKNRQKTKSGLLFSLATETIPDLILTATETQTLGEVQTSDTFKVGGKAPSFVLREIARELVNPNKILAIIETRQKRTRAEIVGAFIAPRSLVEQQLALIWSEVIKVEQVGIDDNFFELGGNSLLATQLVSRLEQAFKLKIPLHSVFEQPTVKSLAEYIDNLNWTIQPNLISIEEELESGEI